MTITFTATHIEIIDSVVLAAYAANNALQVTTNLAYNCGDQEEQIVDMSGVDTTGNYFDNTTSTLHLVYEEMSGVYGIELRYTDGGQITIEKECTFYDKDNELKCKAYSTVTTDNNYLIYEMLAAAAECSDCDCTTVCDAYNLLSDELNDNDGNSNKCTSC